MLELTQKQLRIFRLIQRKYNVSIKFLLYNMCNIEKFLRYARSPRYIIKCVARRKGSKSKKRVVLDYYHLRRTLFDQRELKYIKSRKRHVQQWSRQIVEYLRKKYGCIEYVEDIFYGFQTEGINNSAKATSNKSTHDISHQIKEQLELLNSGKRLQMLIESVPKMKIQSTLETTTEKEILETPVHALNIQNCQKIEKEITTNISSIPGVSSAKSMERSSDFLDMLMKKIYIKKGDVAASSKPNDYFNGLNDVERIPGMFPTPEVPDASKSKTGEIPAFVSESLNEYMRKNSLGKTDNIGIGKSSARKPQQASLDGLVTADCVPPHFDRPHLPERLRKLRTVAGRRKYFQKFPKDHELAIIINETYIFRELRRKARDLKSKSASLPLMSLTRQGWQAASFVATEVNRYFNQTLNVDNGQERVLLPGVRGNNQERSKKPYHSRVLPTRIRNCRNDCIDALIWRDMKPVRSESIMKKLNKAPIPSIVKPCPLSRKPFQIRTLKEDFRFRQNLDETDEVLMDCADMVSGMINSVVISCSENSFIKEDPDQLCPQNNLEMERQTAVLPSNATNAKNEKTVAKRSRLMLELRRLNATIIDVGVKTDKETKPCSKDYCRYGCVCASLSDGYPIRDHCGQAECVIECVCKVSSQSRIMHLGNEGRSINTKDAMLLRRNATAGLAQMEKEFTSTVVFKGNETLLINEPQRRRKAPERYGDFAKDDVSHNSTVATIDSALNISPNGLDTETHAVLRQPIQVPENLLSRLKHCTVPLVRFKDINNISIWCMFHQLYNCFCGGRALEGNPLDTNANVIHGNVSNETDDDHLIVPEKSRFFPEQIKKVKTKVAPAASKSEKRKNNKVDESAEFNTSGDDAAPAKKFKACNSNQKQKKEITPSEVKREIEEKLAKKGEKSPPRNQRCEFSDLQCKKEQNQINETGTGDVGGDGNTYIEVDITCTIDHQQNATTECYDHVIVPTKTRFPLEQIQKVKPKSSLKSEKRKYNKVDESAEFTASDDDTGSDFVNRQPPAKIFKAWNSNQEQKKEITPKEVNRATEETLAKKGEKALPQNKIHDRSDIGCAKERNQLKEIGDIGGDGNISVEVGLTSTINQQQNATKAKTIDATAIATTTAATTTATTSTADPATTTAATLQNTLSCTMRTTPPPTLPSMSSTTSEPPLSDFFIPGFLNTHSDVSRRVVYDMNCLVKNKMQEIVMVLQQQCNVIPPPRYNVLCIVSWMNFSEAFVAGHVFLWQVNAKDSCFFVATITDDLPMVNGAISVRNITTLKVNALPMFCKMLLKKYRHKNPSSLAVILHGLPNYWHTHGLVHVDKSSACTKPTPMMHPLLMRKINTLLLELGNEHTRMRQIQPQTRRRQQQPKQLQSLRKQRQSKQLPVPNQVNQRQLTHFTIQTSGDRSRLEILQMDNNRQLIKSSEIGQSSPIQQLEPAPQVTEKSKTQTLSVANPNCKLPLRNVQMRLQNQVAESSTLTEADLELLTDGHAKFKKVCSFRDVPNTSKGALPKANIKTAINFAPGSQTVQQRAKKIASEQHDQPKQSKFFEHRDFPPTLAVPTPKINLIHKVSSFRDAPNTSKDALPKANIKTAINFAPGSQTVQQQAKKIASEQHDQPKQSKFFEHRDIPPTLAVPTPKINLIHKVSSFRDAPNTSKGALPKANIKTAINFAPGSQTVQQQAKKIASEQHDQPKQSKFFEHRDFPPTLAVPTPKINLIHKVSSFRDAPNTSKGALPKANIKTAINFAPGSQTVQQQAKKIASEQHDQPKQSKFFEHRDFPPTLAVPTPKINLIHKVSSFRDAPNTSKGALPKANIKTAINFAPGSQTVQQRAKKIASEQHDQPKQSKFFEHRDFPPTLAVPTPKINLIHKVSSFRDAPNTSKGALPKANIKTAINFAPGSQTVQQQAKKIASEQHDQLKQSKFFEHRDFPPTLAVPTPKINLIHKVSSFRDAPNTSKGALPKANIKTAINFAPGSQTVQQQAKKIASEQHDQRKQSKFFEYLDFPSTLAVFSPENNLKVPLKNSPSILVPRKTNPYTKTISSTKLKLPTDSQTHRKISMFQKNLQTATVVSPKINMSQNERQEISDTSIINTENRGKKDTLTSMNITNISAFNLARKKILYDMLKEKIKSFEQHNKTIALDGYGNKPDATIVLKPKDLTSSTMSFPQCQQTAQGVPKKILSGNTIVGDTIAQSKPITMNGTKLSKSTATTANVPVNAVSSGRNPQQSHLVRAIPNNCCSLSVQKTSFDATPLATISSGFIIPKTQNLQLNIAKNASNQSVQPPASTGVRTVTTSNSSVMPAVESDAIWGLFCCDHPGVPMFFAKHINNLFHVQIPDMGFIRMRKWEEVTSYLTRYVLDLNPMLKAAESLNWTFSAKTKPSNVSLNKKTGTQNAISPNSPENVENISHDATEELWCKE